MGLGTFLSRLLPGRRRDGPSCEHMGMVQVVTTEAEGCEECLKTGDGWMHLRLCMICGKVGCCDDSPNTHATNHFRAEGHALIRSIEPEDSWAYCFVDEVMLPDPAAGAAAR